MWVWSDELARQFPEAQPEGEGRFPLVAVVVGAETDLEAVAREVMQEYRATADGSPRIER